MTASGQEIYVTELKIAGQVVPEGEVFDWRLAQEALGEISFPIFILFAGEPRLREGEVTASLVYPTRSGDRAETQFTAPARLGLVKLDFTPDAYGEVSLRLHYNDQLYFEEVFSIGPFPTRRGAV